MRLTARSLAGGILLLLALTLPGMARAEYLPGFDQNYAATRDRDASERRVPTPSTARRAAYREPERVRCPRVDGDMGAILGAIAGGLIGGAQDRHGDRSAGPAGGFNREAARNCD